MQGRKGPLEPCFCPEVCDRHCVTAWTGLTVQMSQADVLGVSMQQKWWKSKVEDPSEKVQVDFWKNERQFILTSNLNQVGSWYLGALLFMLSESELGTRFTCTMQAKHLAPPYQLWLSTVLKFRLPGLVFRGRWGTEYVHGCTCLYVSRDPVSFNSEEWHKRNSVILRKGFWRILHIYNPYEYKPQLRQKHFQAMPKCECMSICPCIRDVRNTVHMAVWAHTCGSQRLVLPNRSPPPNTELQSLTWWLS